MPQLAPPAGFLPERLVLIQCPSGPLALPTIDAGAPLQGWLGALARLKAEGYEQLQLLAGEAGDPQASPGLAAPHPDLARWLAAAQAQGLGVSLVSDSPPAGAAPGGSAHTAAALFDNLVVRLRLPGDGRAGVGQRAGELALACRWLAQRAERHRPAAAQMAVGRAAIGALPEVASHLFRHGANALLVRPPSAPPGALTLFGDHDAQRLYQTVLALAQAMAPAIRVQGSLAVASLLWQQREQYAGLLAPWPRPGESRARLSDLVNPLVVTRQGQLKPLAADMHPCFHVGHLSRLGDEAWMRRYARSGVSALQRLVAGALIRLEYHPGVVDWLADLARASHGQPLAGPPSSTRAEAPDRAAPPALATRGAWQLRAGRAAASRATSMSAAAG